MSLANTDMKTFQELEDTIQKAVKKINGKKENDICRYLPVSSGGYMHHFTMRKMKTEEPKNLSVLINKYINGVDKPISVTPKPRAARGSRKRREGISFSRFELEKLLEMAKNLGDADMVSKLSPKKSLAAYRRDLIASVKNNEVNEDLWHNYVEAVAAAEED